MKLAALLLLSCAHVPYEAAECPAVMDAESHASGVVRCRALCSSFARDFASYGANCRCYCMPAPGGSRYRPRAGGGDT